jgi:hypothetical protein
MPQAPSLRALQAAVAPAAATPDYGYGDRYGTTTPKGLGFLGPLQRPSDGGVMSEYSIGTEIDGAEREIPSFVPTLSHDEVAHLLAMQDGEPMPDSIARKARAHASQRLAEGKDPFAGPGEQQQGLYPDLPRTLVPSPHVPGSLPSRPIAPSLAALAKQGGF